MAVCLADLLVVAMAENLAVELAGKMVAPSAMLLVDLSVAQTAANSADCLGACSADLSVALLEVGLVGQLAVCLAAR